MAAEIELFFAIRFVERFFCAPENVEVFEVVIVGKAGRFIGADRGGVVPAFGAAVTQSLAILTGRWGRDCGRGVASPVGGARDKA